MTLQITLRWILETWLQEGLSMEPAQNNFQSQVSDLCRFEHLDSTTTHGSNNYSRILDHNKNQY